MGKKLVGTILATVVISALSIGVYLWRFQPEPVVPSSPVPDSLNLSRNNQVWAVALFSPIFDLIGGSSKVVRPEIGAKSVLLYDLTSQKVLFEKNPTEKLPMASLTKIMTAVVAIENKKAGDKYVVPVEALVGENVMGLSARETLSLQELLYGLMLPSGNDAAETLADNYVGGREAFIQAMNKKTSSLGLGDTHFTNPSGLQGDGEQYTTVQDLLILTQYALNTHKIFATIVATFQHEIPQTRTHKAYFLQNETNLISSYPGVKGVKTGYTPEADLCLVTYLEHSGHKIIGVILGSNNRRQEMKDLLDYGLRIQGITPPPHG